MFKRIIPLILVVVILFSLSAPAFAADVSTSYQQLSYWDKILYDIVDLTKAGGFWGNLFANAVQYGSDGLCDKSDDGFHHSSSKWISRGGGRDGSSSYVFRCDYCEQTFTVTPEQVEDAYNDYVADLPPGLDAGSSGVTAWGDGVTWSEKDKNAAANAFWETIDLYDVFENATEDDQLIVASANLSYTRFLGFSVCLEDGLRWLYPGWTKSLFPYSTVTFSCGSLCRGVSLSKGYVGDGFRVFLSYEEANAYFELTGNSCYFLKPGSYFSFLGRSDNYLGPLLNGIGYISSSGVVLSSSLSPYSYWHCVADSVYSYYIYGFYPLSTDVSGTDFDSGSRPGSITGNYGVIGDSNEITNIGSQIIINEASNTFYNPATGEYEDIESWTYDYATRTYNIVTGDGNTVSINYGDENITINEGDTIYNIYYVVDNSHLQESCKHSYSCTTIKAPSCKVSGLDQYTCDICGHAYTQSTSATGHTWKILRDVNTQYDDTGALVQEGYTIYECEICGEQYKSVDGSLPPTVNSGSSSGSGDSSGGGIFDKIGELFGTVGGGLVSAIGKFVEFVLDSLISLVQMLVDKGMKVIDLILSLFERIPGLFGAFPAFLAAVFPFIPEDMLLIIEFGLVAVVVIGIIKWLRK